MTTDETLVIVGAGLAGAKAATGAREKGFDGRIVLIGEEACLPYERPPLSKGVLRGEAPARSALVEDDGHYQDHDIEVVAGRGVDVVDVAAREVVLADGERRWFSHLVLATGAAVRRLDVPGAGLDGIHHLRTIDDAEGLGAAIRAGGRVAVIGAGWIGSEVAASARQMGAEVVLIDPAPVPLQRVLGDTVGQVFADLHRDHGVVLRLGTGVTELRGERRVDGVVLSDGSVESADVVVVGIGVTPRTDLARAAGLRVDDGVVVDEHLETDVAGVYAVGDVASAWHPHLRRHVRVEHWANALNQGLTAGANVAGAGQAYDRLPYFFSDQYDLGMEYVGLGEPGDAVTIRGDVEARELIAFWQRDGIVTAAMNVNVWDVADDLRAIVASGTPIPAARLSDPDVPLGELAGGR
jgi:3-phenylpropionate/trans-cinnamate dioxygenase ferredoxin reductase component